MNKKSINIIILYSLLFLFCGCEKDNYPEPETWLTGRLVYKGEPFYMDGYYNNTDKPDDVIQFFQDGYGKYGGGWGFRVKEDGTLSALLFKGDYKLVVRDGTYPFEWTGWPKTADNKLDTMRISINKNTVLPDIEVTPYFEINDVEVSGGADIKASFTLREVLPEAGAKAEQVFLYVGPSQLITSSPKFIHVDSDNPGIGQPISMQMPLSQYREGYTNNFRTYCYVRIAVKTDKSSRFLWSKAYKIEDLPEG